MEISHGERAGIAETTQDNLVPPGAEAFEGEPTLDPAEEVARLERFLVERFPGEIGLTNRQAPEQPVDVAIRLLSALGTQGTALARCSEQYCNKVQGHADSHGWVHFR